MKPKAKGAFFLFRGFHHESVLAKEKPKHDMFIDVSAKVGFNTLDSHFFLHFHKALSLISLLIKYLKKLLQNSSIPSVPNCKLF